MSGPSDVALVQTILAKHAYAPGTPGFEVRLAGENVILRYVNAAGAPINIPTDVAEKAIAILKKQFPALDADVFFGYCETVRRKQGLFARWKNFLGDKGAVNFESLDPKDLRRGPLKVNPAEFTGMKTKEIPRFYTFVKTEPKPATRIIYLTELGVDGVRPDEFIIRYTLSKEELALVEKGKMFSEIAPADRVVADLEVHSGDPNRQITGKALSEHFEKSMEGVLKVLNKLTGAKSAGGLEMLIEGSVRTSTTDTFLGPGQFKVLSDHSGITYFRATENGTAIRSRADYRLEGGQWKRITPEATSYSGVGPNLDDKELRASVRRFIVRLEAFLSKLPKKP